MSARNDHILSNPVEYLKGVGPQKGELLKKELGIFTFKDLLEHYPLRHIDKTVVIPIRDVSPALDYVQLAGRLSDPAVLGDKRSRRLVATLTDTTGEIELVWFQGITWIEKMLVDGQRYLVFGKTSIYNGKLQISHPEMEAASGDQTAPRQYLEPVYPSTEKLKARGLGGRQLAKLTQSLITLLQPRDLQEFLPRSILSAQALVSRYQAYSHIHFPPNAAAYEAAVNRLKFDELFVAQLNMSLLRIRRHRYSKGAQFTKVGDLFNTFYSDHLPFQLTDAQKRVVREIRRDLGSGVQMNRLLQGDVGSGKTIVALLCMLLAADNGFQSCLMAPTEILARQHFAGLGRLLAELPVQVRLLTGSVKSAERKKTIEAVRDGTVNMLVGTHAMIEETVTFHQLGLAVVDEQHRFGVAQRARLWAKAAVPPHVLVMTATPIPRTLAMATYGDLDLSIIDELPPNRKPIQTFHRYDDARPQVMDFIRAEIAAGRQAYIIFPLIEESEKVDYENLMRGYEQLKAWFPEPAYHISMVHGRQTPEVRDTNMQRFRSNDTQIMVATTVIEVGVDVPNASVMVIESAEKFGLSQLHQLRGRVGRGAEKSFCILLTGPHLGKEAKERLKTMVATNDGFKIAEKDLELRGPGDIAGTRQSGALDLKLADLLEDRSLLEECARLAAELTARDPELTAAENTDLKDYLNFLKGKTPWSKIS